MATPRRSGNRDMGNLAALPASLVNSLIPLAIILEIGQKDSQHVRLRRVIFLKNRKMVETIPVKPREKAIQ